ncbi:MAG TPA: NADP-dependent oxidoreductase [Steroidobacteraceae bacterium]|nr:NADP-dependent oxidoreductase [Steroidobacteraceae bacterium]
MKRIFASAVVGAFCFAASAAEPPIPATMQAIAIDAPGGPEAMTLRTLPVPSVDANDVLIAVQAAGVAVWDLQIRKSMQWVKPRFPYVLGSDGSGTVVRVGAAVKRLKVGDAVYGYCWDNPKGGFYAEYVAAPADCFAKLPKGVDLESAGALGASGLTALSGVDRALGLKQGDAVIIHGASGAVGTLAVQLAKVRGARVLATASGDDGVALVRRLGADVVIDGRKADINVAARQFAPKGVDAVLALASGEALEKCIDALRHGGKVAYPNGVEPAPRPRDGITIIPYDALFGDQKVQWAELNKAIQTRKFAVPVAATFSLAEAAAAHRRVEAGHVPGKVILKVR